MKFRNFIIVLLAVFMVFALASCKHEPEVKPTPDTPDDPQPAYSEDVIYKLTATRGRNLGWWSADKFVLSFSADAEKVSKGDVLTLKYRSTREITQFNIRNSSNKWIYEQPKKSSGKDYPLPEGFKSEPDADGWITVTFTFGDKWWDGSEITSTTYPSAWRIDFIGEIVTTDVLEVKDIKLTKSDSTVVPLALTQTKVSDTGAYGNILPTFEATHDATWQESADWVVFFFNGEPGEVDGTPEYERVFNGMTFTRDWTKDDKGVAYPEKEHYTLKLLKGYATNSEEFDPKTPITENTRLYVIYVGDPQQVTFNTGEGGSEVAAKTVEYGTYVARPETDPTNGENVFAGWFADANCTTKFDFENTAITADTVIYAGFGASTAVTFNAENGEEEHTVVNVANGFPVAAIADPTFGSKLFDGWYLEGAETPYDFSTPVTAAIVLHAHWVNATDVTLNLNYEGADSATTTFKTALDVALAADDEHLNAPSRDGFFFTGWYDEAACTTAHDFTAVVTAPVQLYAGWSDGTIYRITSKDYTDGYDCDKFILCLDEGFKAGDTLSLTYRTTLDFSSWSIRRTSDDFKIFHEYSSGTYPTWFSYKETTGEWTTVTYVFPAADTAVQGGKIAYGESGIGVNIYFLKSAMVPGVTMEIKAVSKNGVEIDTLTKADNFNKTSKGSVDVDFSVVPSVEEWTAKTVTFNTNGGTAIAATPVNFGASVAKPATDPEKEGSTFAGWYKDEDCTEEFDFGVAIIADTIIYAKWVTPVTLSFDSQGGSVVEAIPTGAGLPIDEPEDPTYEGHVFQGWFEEAECTTPFVFAKGIDASKTVYAKWIDEFTLEFDSQGGSAVTAMKVGSGLAITAPDDPVLEGSAFDGWYEEAECTTPFVFANGITANKTIYAKWISTKTVTLNYNYTGAPANKEVEVSTGGKMDAPIAGQPGYYLDGWYTQAEGGDKINFETYTVSADVTLYAHWTEETTSYVRISFDDAGGAVYKRIDLKFDEISVKEGDIIAFKYRSKGNKVVSACLREAAASKYQFIYWSNLSGFGTAPADEETWGTFYFVFGPNTLNTLEDGTKNAPYPLTGFRLELAQSNNDTNFVTGDWLEILGFSYNGEEKEITSSKLYKAVSSGKATVAPVAIAAE